MSSTLFVCKALVILRTLHEERKSPTWLQKNVETYDEKIKHGAPVVSDPGGIGCLPST